MVSITGSEIKWFLVVLETALIMGTGYYLLNSSKENYNPQTTSGLLMAICIFAVILFILFKFSS
jgi:hypothetical protein